jgi:hypothetical protein
MIKDGRIANWEKRQVKKEDDTAAARKQESRLRKKEASQDVAKSREMSQILPDVAECPDASHDVTTRHDTSQRVTLDKNRIDNKDLNNYSPSPKESEGETPPREPERNIPATDAPAAMRPTVELYLLKTGHEAMTPQDLSAIRALEKLHTPTRVNQEISKALERYSKAGKAVTELTLDYIYRSLQYQTSGKARGKARASPELPESLKIYDQTVNRSPGAAVGGVQPEEEAKHERKNE